MKVAEFIKYVKYFTDRSKAVLLLWIFYVFFSVLCLLCLCARLLKCALWSHAGKGLISWLSFVASNCEFVSFPLVSFVRCDTWLYWFLIFAPLLTSTTPCSLWQITLQTWLCLCLYFIQFHKLRCPGFLDSSVGSVFIVQVGFSLALLAKISIKSSETIIKIVPAVVCINGLTVIFQVAVVSQGIFLLNAENCPGLPPLRDGWHLRSRIA